MSAWALLSTAYFPPVQYFSKFLLYEHVQIEACENYQKQSYRNRCYIYGANGKQCLVIPVVKNHGEKTPITSVMIDYKSDWQKIHLKSIESAYALSPFYEFYADAFIELFNDRTPLLFDWNLQLIKKVLNLLSIRCDIQTTSHWIPLAEDDYRTIISPKKRLEEPDRSFSPIAYQQVFEEKYGFLGNLSIIDLLFNEGPQALPLLKKSIPHQ